MQMAMDEMDMQGANQQMDMDAMIANQQYEGMDQNQIDPNQLQ